jgi:peptide/nickel transport system permease protein
MDELTLLSDIGVEKRKGKFRLMVLRFSRNKLAVVGLFVIAILMILCFSAPLFISYNKVITQNISERFLSPGAPGHILGTDQYGRDLFARIMYGGRTSLSAGISSVAISFVLGLIVGCVAGFFGGMTDNIIMRICDVIMAIPGILLTMAIVAAFGQGLSKMLIALSFSGIPGSARSVRAVVMTLRSQEYVDAARTYGSSVPRILVKHIVPNIIGPLVVGVTMQVGTTILRIASLGFLGIGIAPPTPEWGTIISENANNIRFYPFLGLVPGLFIMIAVLSLTFVGNGLRDALDPKMKK